jgi:hypothetical protein
LDGNICVQSLVDVKDVQLRNFARPVQAVALSPEYKTDRMYLSGGLSGQLILTVGAPTGRSTAMTTGATAQAAGWLGGMVGASTGKDTVLHSGEGTISTIKWSLSGRYVVWLNEHGIKIMRTKLHLDSADADDAWKRIGHIDRPQTDEWDTMASVWKGRAEWIDEQSVEPDDSRVEHAGLVLSLAAESLKQQQLKNTKKIERLLVGWGGTIWIIHVHPGGIEGGKTGVERSAGRAEIVKMWVSLTPASWIQVNPCLDFAWIASFLAFRYIPRTYYWFLLTAYPRTRRRIKATSPRKPMGAPYRQILLRVGLPGVSDASRTARLPSCGSLILHRRLKSTRIVSL